MLRYFLDEFTEKLDDNAISILFDNVETLQETTAIA